MSFYSRKFGSRQPREPAAAVSLDPRWCGPQATWRQRQRFQEAARTLIRLPSPGSDPVDYLHDEVAWSRFAPPDDREEVILAALSQATGVYFFPSREWVSALCRFLRRLEIRRFLEAGAGRGYLAAVLQPILARQGIAFKAVDNAQGEFESGLPRHPVVELTDVLSAVEVFRPDLVFYAWPPPGQTIGPLCHHPGVRYVLIVGEPNGGCTGDPLDWERFNNRFLKCLSRYGFGRSGRRRHAATIFFAKASSHFRERAV